MTKVDEKVLSAFGVNVKKMQSVVVCLRCAVHRAMEDLPQKNMKINHLQCVGLRDVDLRFFQFQSKG